MISESRELTPQLITELRTKFIAHKVRQRFPGEWRTTAHLLEDLTSGPGTDHLQEWLSRWHLISKYLFTAEEKQSFEEQIAGKYLLEVTNYVTEEAPPMVQFVEFLRFSDRQANIYTKLRVYECGEAGYMVKYTAFSRTRFILLNGKNTRLQPADFVCHFARYLGEERNDVCAMEHGVNFICERLRQTVAQIEQDAAESYDEACAVDPSGSSIVCADEVHVVDGDSVEIYSAKLFLEDKIQKPLKVGRTINDGPTYVQNAVKRVASGDYEGVFLRAARGDGGRIFVVAASYVPRHNFSPMLPPTHPFFSAESDR
jgi:hypothetical protein